MSTSPRTTWLWAPNDQVHQDVRRTLKSHDALAKDAYGRGVVLPLVTDVEIGYEAGNAMELLTEAGYTFAWHPSQDPRNRRDQLRGYPVAPADEAPPV